ncbi:MAG: NADH-quinone oxidoreductase subunit C [Chloroflexi bacterium]|nr:NADH-quinone oxidoreductase subunit C [Chloroflexota bacterium]
MDRETTISQSLESARILLAPCTQQLLTPEPGRMDISLATADLLPAVAALHLNGWGRLVAVTGLDLGVNEGDLEVLYHFCAGAAIVTLRVRVPKADAAIPTICSLIPAASFYERELGEMFGITVVGTPNPDRLFLPDDWPAGVYPLRKDFVVPEIPG